MKRLISNNKVRRQLVRAYINIYRLKYNKQAVPLEKVLNLRRLVDFDLSLLLASNHKPKLAGQGLHNRYLAEILATDELGGWRLDSTTLNFLEDEIGLRQPKVILEFGSGISTICLAHFMRELHGHHDRCYVYSVEQDNQYAFNLQERLSQLGLQQHVLIIQAPLTQLHIEGFETECYDLPTPVLDEFFVQVRPDFILIDGPVGKDGSRFGTLVQARKHLSNKATFFLDDALRDSELGTAALWSNLPYISIQGLYLKGKGMLKGQIYSPSSEE